MRLFTYSVCFLVFLQYVSTFDSSNILFVIVSQPEPYYASVAARLKDNIETQVQELKQKKPSIYLTHEDFPIKGAWTFLPLFPLISKLHRDSAFKWVLFVEPHTAVRCRQLVDTLARLDPDKDVQWVGYPLTDEEPTIIHHFRYYTELEDDGGLPYPYLASGFAMRMELVNSLPKSSSEWRPETDFSIDASFELAQHIYGDRYSRGPLLTPDLSFCVVSADECATYPRPFDICGKPIPESSIYFAVKTWSGYHATRAKVVKKTWGKHVTHLKFYSDVADRYLPSIETGVPNTKGGHCAKTMAILRHAVAAVKDTPIQWIFLADDDTILGVHRVREVLSCLRGGDALTALGERYGYAYGNQHHPDKGYDYITGGGGAALSVGAAALLSRCACAAPHAPDDMVLGACAHTHNLNITHSPLFHQARPQDYSREYLSRDRPVSFHRHSSPPPAAVYVTWFRDHHTPSRDEL